MGAPPVLLNDSRKGYAPLLRVGVSPKCESPAVDNLVVR